MKKLGFITVTLILVALMIPMLVLPTIALATPPPDTAGAPSGDGVQPILVAGNPDCEDLAIGCVSAYKIDTDPAPGDYGDSTLEVTITRDGKYFSWTANKWICAVIVKAGTTGSNVYYYDTNNDCGDTDLHAPVNGETMELRDISHVEFCYCSSTPCVPELSTIALMSLGLLAMGGFVWMKKRNNSAAAA